MNVKSGVRMYNIYIYIIIIYLSITLDSTIDDPEPLSAQNEDPHDAHHSASFVPSSTQWITEQETVRQSVQE